MTGKYFMGQFFQVYWHLYCKINAIEFYEYEKLVSDYGLLDL